MAGRGPVPDHFLLNDHSVSPSGERDTSTKARVYYPYEEQEAGDRAKNDTNHSPGLGVRVETCVGGRDR
jgi:hypothetical protein